MPTIALASAARTEPPGSSGILPPPARTRCSPGVSDGGRSVLIPRQIVAKRAATGSGRRAAVEDVLDALGVLLAMADRRETGRARVVGEARERRGRVLVERVRLDADDLERL